MHAMRTDFDAVLVGAGTVVKDDPRLTVRGMPGNDPHVVVLDGELRLGSSAKLIRAGKRRTVFVADHDAGDARAPGSCKGTGHSRRAGDRVGWKAGTIRTGRSARRAVR